MPKIALVQRSLSSEPRKNRALQFEAAEQAYEGGAQIVCFEELCETTYFCNNQDVANFTLAVTLPSDTISRFCALAKKCHMVIIYPFFEKKGPGFYYNSAAIIDADGSIAGIYRKMHIPQDPGFEEKFYFTPGDPDQKLCYNTAYGPLGVLICWDQWFPELARLSALAGAQIVFYPTAIGYLPEEKELLGAKQKGAWKRVMQGHAVANGCYVAAVNRVGIEGETEFWGNSFVADFFGETIAEASSDTDEILFADTDFTALEDFRRIWPFFRDRRIDAYSGITKRIITDE